MQTDFRYINLIRFQNELIAKLLGYANIATDMMRAHFCSEAHHLFSTSIMFSAKLKYALGYLDEPHLFKNYRQMREIYLCKIQFFHIKKIALPL